MGSGTNETTPKGAAANHAAQPLGGAAPARGDRVEKWIRGVVLFVIAVVPLLAFGFSFGNVGLLGVSLGIDPRIAFLTGPIVDLSVTGLIVAASYLSYVGNDERDLWPVHLMSAVCGIVMIALNCGQALRAHQWQRAGFDAVAPALLIGWGFLGPWLLRKLADARTALAPPATGSTATVPEVPAEADAQVPVVVPAHVPGPGSNGSGEVGANGSGNRVAQGPCAPAGTAAQPAANAARTRRRAGAETPAAASFADRAKDRDDRKAQQLEIVRALVDEHGPNVTLKTIIAHTGVSKSCASRYRSEVVDGPAPAAPAETADTELEPEREMEFAS
jgi:hypothetical protein